MNSESSGSFQLFPGQASSSYKFLLWLFIAVLSADLLAQDTLNPRVVIGANLLPSVLAANESLEQLAGSQKAITVFIVYTGERELAEEIARKLSKIEKVRQLPLHTRVMSYEELMQQQPQAYGALFLVEKMERQRNQLIEMARKYKLILFSPFKGEVRKGVSAGIEVTNKVLPAVNSTTLTQSGIRLKAFFMRVAVEYD